MKFGSIGRSLMRWLRPPATSVSAIFEPKPFSSISATFSNTAWKPEPALAHYSPPVEQPPMVRWSSATSPTDWSVDPSTGSKAMRPGIVPPGLEMPWPDWRKLEAELDAPPGWSACRFPTWCPGEHPVRIESGAVDTRPEHAGTCAFVLGIVRGDFGIWRSPFPVCHTGDDGMLIEQREDVLAAVTHLRTGLGMGIFTDRDAAIASCTAAEGLGIDWRLLDPNDKSNWGAAFSRLRQARLFAGITICRTRHAHQGNPDGPPLSIWEQSAAAVAEGRPERLS